MTDDNVEPVKSGWKFEKRISVDTMIAVGVIAIAIGGPMFLAWRSMETRLLVLETLQTEYIKQQVIRDAETRDQRVADTTRADKLSVTIQAMQIDIARLITIQQSRR